MNTFTRFWQSNLLLFAAMLVPGMGVAETYYVAVTGSDTNPGTLAAPWRTIQKAANSLAPGDTVYVRGGVYNEAVTVNVAGVPGAPVTFAAFPGENPTIAGTGLTVPSNVDTGLFLIVGRDDVIIRGFELRDYKTTDPARVPAGVFIRNSSRVEIRDCLIHEIWKTGGTRSNAGGAFAIAVYGSATTPTDGVVIENNEIRDCKTGWSETVAINGNVTNFTVSNNRIHDCNNIGIDCIGFEGTCSDTAQDQARDGVCRGNHVWNISSEGNQAYAAGDYSAAGIYVDGGTRIVIERNISHDNDIGIELASESAGKRTSLVTLRDNLIYRNRQTGLYLGGYAATGTGGTANCTITGNTFRDNDTLNWDNGEVSLRYRTSNCTFRNNLFVTGSANWLITVPVGASHNVNNTFNYNLYHSPTGASAARWRWNNSIKTGFATWQSASGQDASSRFAEPRFRSTAADPDLRLRLDSPAIDAGDPTFSPASGEADFEGSPRLTGPRVDIGADELSRYEHWAFLYVTDGSAPADLMGPANDPDNDGLSNLVEYAFGNDPSDPSDRSAPTLGISGNHLTLTFTPKQVTDLSYVVEASADLHNWLDQVNVTGLLQADQPYTFTDSADLALYPRRFLRLRVSMP